MSRHTHTHYCVCVIVCFVADPGLHSQACTLSTEPCFERGYYPPWVCFTVPSPLYLPQKNKRTHAGIKAVPEMTVPVQKSPLAWTDITGTQTLWPQSLLVCADWSCIDLSWKCPSGPRRSRCHRGKQAETSAAVRCETQTHRPPMSTSLWTQDVSIGNPRQISILKRFCVR